MLAADPGNVAANIQLDASNSLLKRAWRVWRFALDWVQGRGFWAVMYYPPVIGLPRPP
jgi:hypothetical protein